MSYELRMRRSKPNANWDEWPLSFCICPWIQLKLLLHRPGAQGRDIDNGVCSVMDIAGEWAGWGRVMMWGYIFRRLEYGSTCGSKPAESAVTSHTEVIYHSDNMSDTGSEFERLGSI